MKAAIFAKPNEPLAIGEWPTPEAKAGEILVKVAACGVCHTDLHYIDHGVPTFKKPPLVLGHEASGIVAARLTPQVLGVAPGVLAPPLRDAGSLHLPVRIAVPPFGKMHRALGDSGACLQE